MMEVTGHRPRVRDLEGPCEAVPSDLTLQMKEVKLREKRVCEGHEISGQWPSHLAAPLLGLHSGFRGAVGWLQAEASGSS